LSFILKKFDQFECRIEAIWSALSAIVRDVQQLARSQVLLPEWPALSAGQSVSNNSARPIISNPPLPPRPATSVVNVNNNLPGANQLFHEGIDWAAVTSTPQSHGDRVGGSTSGASGQDDADNLYTMVVRSSRARKRHRQSTADGQHQRFQSTTSETSSKTATVTSNVLRRGPLLVGKADPTSHHCLQAAAQCLRSRPDDRAMFYVDNVSLRHSVDNVRALVESMGIRVISCFEIQPRGRRRFDDESPPSRKAFRLCIRDSDRSALLVAGRWPANVTVSEWYFKSPAVVRDDQRAGTIPAVNAADAARSESATAAPVATDTATVSAFTDNALVLCGYVPTAGAIDSADEITPLEQVLSLDNRFSILNEMDCNDCNDCNDDTLVHVFDKSAIITTVNDGCKC